MRQGQPSFVEIPRRVTQACAGAGRALRRRIGLLRGSAPEHAHSPAAKLLLGEVLGLFEAARQVFQPPLPIARSANPRVVILLPGFAAGPIRMRFMARQLERAGHTVKRWGLGYNLGPSEERFGIVSDRVCEVHRRYGERVVLVGWSLGGIFAREIAKRHPDKVEKVITLGSPFSHSPYSNNVWRIYQLVTGHSVENPPLEVDLTAKPPVETVAMWSPRDGVIAPRSACGRPGERDRAVALRCTHWRFSNSPEAVMAVYRELERG
jgi:pimeloyl-ACP methyl ester carboxylesterase